jgi:hydrogenase nickel incorporation protein HypA/HybF
MHEMGIAMQVIDAVCERAEGARVTRVVLEIGQLAAVMPDALRFSFELASEDSAAQGARLEIIETPGSELRIREMEVL